MTIVRGIALAFLSGRPHWVCAQALLAVPVLRAPISLLCSDERGQTEGKGVPDGYPGAAYQICETEILPAGHSLSLPMLRM